jgi:hypothetical protein
MFVFPELEHGARGGCHLAIRVVVIDLDCVVAIGIPRLRFGMTTVVVGARKVVVVRAKSRSFDSLPHRARNARRGPRSPPGAAALRMTI